MDLKLANIEIQQLVDTLNEKFEQDGIMFSHEFDNNLGKYMIICSDFESYMYNKKLKNWRKVLSKKYEHLQFFLVYQSNMFKLK